MRDVIFRKGIDYRVVLREEHRPSQTRTSLVLLETVRATATRPKHSIVVEIVEATKVFVEKVSAFMIDKTDKDILKELSWKVLSAAAVDFLGPTYVTEDLMQVAGGTAVSCATREEASRAAFIVAAALEGCIEYLSGSNGPADHRSLIDAFDDTFRVDAQHDLFGAALTAMARWGSDQSRQTFDKFLNTQIRPTVRSSLNVLTAAFQVAAAAGKDQFTEAMLTKFPRIGKETRSGAILNAAQYGNTKIVRELMDTRARGDRTKDGSLALRCAAANGHKLTVEMIFGLPSFGLDVFTHRAGQNSALFLAAAGGHSEVVLFLAEQGMSVDEQGWYGSPLQVAALRGKKTTVETLVLLGADPYDNGNYSRGSTTLVRACETNRIEIVRYLLEKVPDMREKSWPQSIMIAALRGNRELVELLGGEGELKVDSMIIGQTALNAAIYGGDIGTVALLLDLGADPDATEIRDDAMRPVNIAATMEFNRAVSLLVSRGSRPPEDCSVNTTLYDRIRRHLTHFAYFQVRSRIFLT